MRMCKKIGIFDYFHVDICQKNLIKDKMVFKIANNEILSIECF